MSSPSRRDDAEDEDEDATMSSPERTRGEQRPAHNAPLAAHLQQMEQEHEERKAAAAREHERLLQGERDYALGNFEPDEPADSAMDTTPNNTAPADADMANSPAGGNSSSMVRGSAEEIALLRSLLGNENGAHDEMYRNLGYMNADTLDDTLEPIFYNQPSPPTR